MEHISIPWAPCFCDPWLGVAHFDGITIRADPITSARPDRVLPTIIDEQIALCRYIASRERHAKGLKAIDLGSGSGVLSIYAAMLGMNVKGLDIEDRALDYANFNKARQDQSVWTVNGGLVDFALGDARDLQDRAAYDVVLMNPPFSPTIDVKAPKCTNGGTTGQELFFAFLDKSAQLLRPGGRCYAVHLLETDDEGNPCPEFSAHVESPQWSSCRMLSVRLPRKRAADFLRLQYAWSDDLKDDSSALVKQIRRAEQLEIFYDIVIVEARRTDLAKDSRPATTREELRLGGLDLPADWTDRILLHNQVLLNSTWQKGATPDAFRENASRIPSGSVLLQTTSIGHSQPEANKRSASSRPLRMLDEWLAQNDVLCEGTDTGIHALMVEAVPWSHRGLSGINSETTLWSRDAETETLRGALEAILGTIAFFNKAKRSVFRHPGLRAPPYSHWEISALRMTRHSNVSPGEPDGTGQKIDAFPTISASTSAVSHSHPIEKFSITSRSNEGIDPAAFEKHLNEALGDFSGILRRYGLIPDEKTTCHFVVLPLPLPTPEHKSEGEVGSIYVYAWSTAAWSPFLESRVLDIARVASAFYGHQFTNDSADRIKAADIGTILHSAQHELARIIDIINGEITNEAAGLVRNLFRLHLELDTFAPRNEPPDYWNDAIEGVSRLAHAAAIEAFVIHRALTKRPDYNPWQATQDDIARFKQEACEMISVADSSGWERVNAAWRILPMRGREHGYFRAAIIAAIRNVLKHVLDKDTKKQLKITLAPSFLKHRDKSWPAITVSNTYESSLYEGHARDQYRSKVESDDAGTAKVLAHYARQIVGGDIAYVPPSRFLLPCDPISTTMSNMWRHRWVSIVPLPASEEVKK